ncbi:MAG: tetratricopeptide repeat protein [Pirellulales bacterium]|nr:tetratricopeptide repeat protein [Pirellulales bacterium]
MNACKKMLRFVCVTLLLVSAGCATFSKSRGPELTPGQSATKLAAETEKSYTALRAEIRDLRSNDKLDEAREVCRTMIKQYPDRHDGYHQLALISDRQKRYREAQALYAQALRIKRADGELFNDLGYSYYLSGQMAKSESALAKAVALAPYEDRYRINLGLVLGQQQRHDEALEQFRQAGSEADAQYNLAFVFATQSNASEAKACFQRALLADPTNEKARKALASFEEFERDPRAAAREAQLAADARGYIPYVEDDGKVVQASAQQRTGRAPTAALERQAQAMIDARLSNRGN